MSKLHCPGCLGHTEVPVRTCRTCGEFVEVTQVTRNQYEVACRRHRYNALLSAIFGPRVPRRPIELLANLQQDDLEKRP